MTATGFLVGMVTGFPVGVAIGLACFAIYIVVRLFR